MNILEHVLADPKLRAEIDALMESGRSLPRANAGSVTRSMLKSVIHESSGFKDDFDPAVFADLTDQRPWSEAVILEYTRPVLLIKNNRFDLPSSAEMSRRLLSYRPTIERSIPAVGRIELLNHPKLRYGGTGWVVAEGIIATNRHVAEEFAYRKNGQILFTETFQGDTIQASIDFAEEIDSDPTAHSHEVVVEEVVFMPDKDPKLPDIALLRLRSHGTLPAPIPLQTTGLRDRLDIAVIGYPAKDFRGVENSEAARRIFGDVYDVKRLSPGQVMITNDQDWFFTHDATTLGGNSGSVIIDMSTGAAVGMHFLGKLHLANYAVKAGTILECLTRNQIAVAETPRAAESLNLPVGDIEAPIESYDDRVGYEADFLGDDLPVVPLPEVKNTEHLLRFNGEGEEDEQGESVLKYTHFSVAINKTRRLCYYSAVNINGKESLRGLKRPGWRYDSRVPQKYQIAEECYGDAPMFSRGHMTRREDPIWGSEEEAHQGNRDSMHYTNVTPQMQMFNSPVWLGLEKYALETSRQDQTRISVFTGPVFTDQDKEYYGVLIPVKFWKVIAFVHDETKQLTATGYIMSQENFLRDEESVYGPYIYNDENYQVPISYIEQLTRLSFGPLAQSDPLNGEAFTEGAISKLQSLEDIRFV